MPNRTNAQQNINRKFCCSSSYNQFIRAVANIENSLADAIEAQSDLLKNDSLSKEELRYFSDQLEEMLKLVIKKEIILEFLIDDIVQGCKHCSAKPCKKCKHKDCRCKPKRCKKCNHTDCKCKKKCKYCDHIDCKCKKKCKYCDHIDCKCRKKCKHCHHLECKCHLKCKKCGYEDCRCHRYDYEERTHYCSCYIFENPNGYWKYYDL